MRVILWIVIILSLTIGMVGCSPPPSSPQSPDLSGEVATVVAQTQTAIASQAPQPFPTATLTPQPSALDIPAGSGRLVVRLDASIPELLKSTDASLVVTVLRDSGLRTTSTLQGGVDLNEFALDIPEGAYRVYARFALANEVEYFGYWQENGGLQSVQVIAGQENRQVVLQPAPTGDARCQPGYLEPARLDNSEQVYAALLNCPSAAITDASVLQQRLLEAIIALNFDAMAQWMADPFMIGLWRSEGVTVSSSEALQELKTSHLGPGSQVTLEASNLAEAWLEMSPISLLPPERRDGAAFLLLSGWGLTGEEQALLLLTRQPDGAYVWYGLVRAPQGFQTQPTPTPQPTAENELPNLGQPTWRDSFDQNRYGWYLFNENDYVFEMKNDRLYMSSLDSGLGDYWTLLTSQKISNAYLEATIVTGPVCQAEDRYGILARSPKSSEGYIFSFSCGGSFRLYIMQAGKYTGIQEWRTSEYILKGPNQTNRMGIWLQGQTIRLYANGKLIGAYQDNTFDEGIIGLMIGARQTSGLELYAEEIAYWELP